MDSPGLSSAPFAVVTASSPRRPPRLVSYLWVILKNLIGWVLIFGSGAVGLVSPGPFGVPLFLIGFALITFPGKRKLTARVLKGKPVARDSRGFRRGVAGVALIVPAVALFYLAWKYRVPSHLSPGSEMSVGAAYFLGATILWFAGVRSVVVINRLMRITPTVRRRVRPWLRRKGFDLLPPRRRQRRLRRTGEVTRAPDEEILEIGEQHRQRVRGLWSAGKPWLRRSGGIVITAAIFVWICRPIVKNWQHFRIHVSELRWSHILLASLMFASFLFVFRAMTWRRILHGFGHRIPIWPTTRVWSTGELARYLPGVIWQMVGRAYLIRPYGVRGSVCSTSQVLELVIFLLANVLLAVSCLIWDGVKHMHGIARVWLFVALGLVPVLVFLMHPRIFYGLANAVMRKIGKPSIPRRMSFRMLAGLLIWSVIGLIWQSLAIWLIMEKPLGLQPTKWWTVAGAYSLAWCAGFLAVWAPGGIGVRELVFITAMQFILPKPVREHFSDPGARLGFLAFLAVLLRLWATAGELMLAGIAYVLDFKGALGQQDAPGRIPCDPAVDAI